MSIDLNAPEVKEAIEARIADETKGLKAKVDELLGKLKKAQKDAQIDPEEHAKLQADYQRLEEQLDTANKAVKKAENASAKLVEQLQAETAAVSSLLIDDGLTAALVKAGVAPQFMDATKALLRQNAKVVADGGTRKAVVGDKELTAFVSEWAQSETGKAFVKAPDNRGGDAGGGQGGNGQQKLTAKPERKNYPDEAAYFRDAARWHDQQQAA